ncbi:MAG: cytochrome c-type biogenesis protein [Phenylobacterium sp.]
MRRLLVIAGAVLCLGAASDPAERLPDPAQEAHARALFDQIRCMVCQNESIDDSDAELAADLRRLVRTRVAAGQSDEEIKAYLTDRYGEFVLLRPSFSAGNLALWLAPAAALIAGLALLFGRLRKRPQEAELTAAESARLRGLGEE